MRLHPHFSPFVICNVDGENLVLFCTEKTIYRMTSLHAFNRLSCDSLCHIWLVLMTFDTPTSYFTTTYLFSAEKKLSLFVHQNDIRTEFGIFCYGVR